MNIWYMTIRSSDIHDYFFKFYFTNNAILLMQKIAESLKVPVCPSAESPQL